MRGCHVVESTVQCDNGPLDLPFFCSVALIRPSMPPLGAALSIVGKERMERRMEFLDFKRVELGLLVIRFRKIRFQVWDVLDLKSLSYWPVCELCIWYVLTTDLLKRMKQKRPKVWARLAVFVRSCWTSPLNDPFCRSKRSTLLWSSGTVHPKKA